MYRYELTNVIKTLEMNGAPVTLHRIRATQLIIMPGGQGYPAGTLGGWIESEKNLQESAWVADNAIVCGQGVVMGHALVCESATVCDNAYVGGNAVVSGYAVVCEHAVVKGNAQVHTGMVSGYRAIEKENF